MARTKSWGQRLARLMVQVVAAIPICVWAAEPDSADPLLQRYINASGGANRLGALRSRVTEATMRSGWFSVSVKTTQIWPDRIHVEARVPLLGRLISSGYDGTVGWATGEDGALRQLAGRELQEFLLGQRLDRLVRLFELYPSRHLLPAGTDGSQRVELKTTFGTSETWTFDPATGLLRSTDGQRDEGPKKGVVRVVSRFEDYRNVDGLVLPFKCEVQDGKDQFTVAITKIEDNVSINASSIEIPASVKAP